MTLRSRIAQHGYKDMKTLSVTCQAMSAGSAPFAGHSSAMGRNASPSILAGDAEPQTQASHLYMLLLITWLAGYPPAARGCLAIQPLLPVLVSCIESRLASGTILALPAHMPCVCHEYLESAQHCSRCSCLYHMLVVSWFGSQPPFYHCLHARCSSCADPEHLPLSVHNTVFQLFMLASCLVV